MLTPSDKLALSFDGVITSLAHKRCGMAGIEMDDLIQEGRLEAWSKLLKGETPTEADFVNCMRRYMRAVRTGRTIVYQDM